jgi:hypothetical protein
LNFSSNFSLNVTDATEDVASETKSFLIIEYRAVLLAKPLSQIPPAKMLKYGGAVSAGF